jgi:hypothetical protein
LFYCFPFLIPFLFRRKKPTIKEPSSKRAKPSPATIPLTPDAPTPSVRIDIDMEDSGGQFDQMLEINPTTEAAANDVVRSEKASGSQGQVADTPSGGNLYWRQKQLEVVNLISSQEDASNQLSSGIAAFVEKTSTMKKVCTPSSPRARWRIRKFNPLWCSKVDFCKFLNNLALERW